MTTQPLRICSLEITNTYGCEYFKVSGPFTVIRIRGKNGTGKSSILGSVTYAFGGGADPSVIRKWCDGFPSPNPSCALCGGKGCHEADKSNVFFALSDGTTNSKTTRPKRGRKGGEITGYTTDLEITQPDGQPRKAPQTYLNELGELNAIDPSALLRIDASSAPGRQKLSAELMRLVPITFDPADIGDECLRYLRKSEYLPDRPLPLDALKQITVGITEERRITGRTRDDTAGAIARLQKILPESTLPVVEQYMAGKSSANEEAAARKVLEEAEEYRRTVESAIAESKLDIEQDKAQSLAAAREKWSVAVQATNTEIDEKVRLLELERSRRNDEHRAAKNQEDLEIAQRIERRYLATDAESRPVLDAAIAAVEAAKAQVTAQARAVYTREEIERNEAICREATIKYDHLSGELQRLEALRLDKLKHLPVAGLVVEDGVPYLDGIVWSNVNLERRVEAVIQICTQRSGKLPLILWDDSEHADNENRELIEQGLVEAGYQVIRAEVSDSPLQIEVVREPVHA